MAHTRVPKITDEVFWSRVDKSGDCWLWTGPIAKATGYGKAGRRGAAHQVAYELLVGPVLAGLQLDHLCRNRLCCKPAHLEPVTARENLLRSPDTHAGKNARKTHCPQGHPLSGENLETTPQKRRKCRTCRSEQSRRAYLARKAQRSVARPDA